MALTKVKGAVFNLEDNINAVSTFADADATPSIADADVFKTANTGSTTITALDGGITGKTVVVIIGDANTTIDFTGTTLIGNGGVDWSPASGDHMTCVFDGTNWYCDVTTKAVQAGAFTTLSNTGLSTASVSAGITADVGSAQGGSPLTKDINEISTCANTGDSVTLPSAAAGLRITIINNGANAADVFPASGDNLGAGVDTAASLASGSNITYVAYDATNWESV